MERPGIHPRWAKQNDLGGKPPKPHYSPEQTGELAAMLEFHATHPDTEEIYQRTKPGAFRDPNDTWWTWLFGPCDRYAAHMLDRFQVRTLATGEWDHEHASRHADIRMLNTVILLASRKRAVERGEPFFFVSASDASYAVVLLMLEGETRRALRWANALVSATRWAPFKQAASAFTSSFILEVLGDYLGRTPARIPTPVFPQKAFSPEPYYSALRQSWRTADAGQIAELLLAAYDCHTQLSWSGTRFHEREFTNGFFPRVPLAGLLVCKLRELEGMPNPRLEHPLLDCAMGRVPRPGYVEDALIGRLRDRLDAGGVNIEETLAFYQGDSPP